MASVNPEIKTGRLSAAAFCLFMVLALSLFRMQILQGSYYRALSKKNHIRLVYLEAARGKILDRNGKPIVTNRLSFNCTAFLRESHGSVSQSIRRLAGLLDERPEDLKARFEKKRAGVYNTVLLAEDIEPEKAMAVEEELHRLPGIMVETRPVREYPLGEAAAHLSGFIGPLTGSEAQELEGFGYRPSDWIGRDGIEKNYENYLKGRSGGLQLEVNSRGQFLRVLGVKEPEEGRPLYLSVDADLQQAVQKLLDGRPGAVMVMELGAGEILAMNSSPSYNPNLFASTKGRKKVDPYLSGDFSPMLNRSIQGQYPLGSVFKVITGLAALESRKITPASTQVCPGFYTLGNRVFRCWKEKGHGAQNLTEAYAHSCDIYFYLAGLAAGPDAIGRKAMEFGFAAVTGVDLPGEKKGLVPSKAWKQKKLQSGWFDGDTLNFSIGQGYLQVTPIQALNMMAAIATDGRLLRPHLVKQIDKQTVAVPHARHVELSPAHLQAIQEGLHAVVNSDTGTGRLAKIPGVTVAGKTGTAEAGKEDTHAWYAGYAPAENPKVAFVIFLEHGGHGGVEAAAVARGTLEKLKEKHYL